MLVGLNARMAFEIISIKKLECAIYQDVIWIGREIQEVRSAPVDSFYQIEVVTNGQTVAFEAEIRSTTQTDWSDEFQDFMMAHTHDKADWLQVGAALFSVHIGEHVSFPIRIGEHESATNPQTSFESGVETVGEA